MSQFYLPKQESEWVKSQGKGYLLKLVRGAMALHESPSEERPDSGRLASAALLRAKEKEAEVASPVPFTEVKPRLLSGSALFHPYVDSDHTKP